MSDFYQVRVPRASRPASASPLRAPAAPRERTEREIPLCDPYFALEALGEADAVMADALRHAEPAASAGGAYAVSGEPSDAPDQPTPRSDALLPSAAGAPEGAPRPAVRGTSPDVALIGIYEISKILASARRLEITLANVVNVLSSMLQMRHGMIVILDPEGEPDMVEVGS